MSPFERFGNALTRLATLTSVRRTRAEDAVRVEAHGGPVDEMQARQSVAADRLEKVLAHLEARV